MGNEESPKPKIEKGLIPATEEGPEREKRDLEYHPIKENIDINEALRQLEKSLAELEGKFPRSRFTF